MDLWPGHSLLSVNYGADRISSDTHSFSDAISITRHNQNGGSRIADLVLFLKCGWCRYENGHEIGHPPARLWLASALHF